MPPGSRQAIPMTAMDVTPALSTGTHPLPIRWFRKHLLIRIACWDRLIEPTRLRPLAARSKCWVLEAVMTPIPIGR